MRKIREALRLSFEGLSTREMALSLAIGRTTLREYLGRARDAGLSWPLPDALSDADLEHVLFPRRSADSSQPIPQPDWTHVHAELRRIDLKRKIEERFGVTMHERTVGKQLASLGFRRLSARPQHPKSDPDAQEAFKKTSPQR